MDKYKLLGMIFGMEVYYDSEKYTDEDVVQATYYAANRTFTERHWLIRLLNKMGIK